MKTVITVAKTMPHTNVMTILYELTSLLLILAQGGQFLYCFIISTSQMVRQRHALLKQLANGEPRVESAALTLIPTPQALQSGFLRTAAFSLGFLNWGLQTWLLGIK